MKPTSALLATDTLTAAQKTPNYFPVCPIDYLEDSVSVSALSDCTLDAWYIYMQATYEFIAAHRTTCVTRTVVFMLLSVSRLFLFTTQPTRTSL